jgi:C1A family cysteine protease
MKNRTIVFIFAALLALPFISVSSSAQERAPAEVRGQIANVQKAIKEKGARWIAGETPVSGLSREDWQYLVGLNFEPMDSRPAPEADAAAAPSAVDWRDHDGNYVSGVRAQKKCGSCWAFAMTGALESYVMRARRVPGVDVDLSEQVLLSCSGAGSCTGGRLNAAFLKSTGLPVESVYPYTATDGACSAAAPYWQSFSYKIGNWGSVPMRVSALKAALAAYGPLPTAMMVYEDLMHYKEGVYSYTTGKRLGGHAVLLVGYNDAGQYFIVKNSWDTGWGENGFFRIAYSEMENSVNFGMSTIAYYTPKDASGTVFNADAAWLRAAPRFENITWN